METLRQEDLDSLRDFLLEASSPCDLSTFGSRILPAVQKLVPSTIVCYAQIDPALQKTVLRETFPLAEMDDEAFDHYMFDHPVFQHWMRVGEAAAARTSDFLSQRKWHKFGLYQTVYKLWDCEDSLAIGLPAPAGLISCVCSERGLPFSDRERTLMELVRPHLGYAYRNAEAFTLLGQASQPEGSYSVLLDKHARPILASRQTWQVIWDYFPLAPVEEVSVLPPDLAAWARRELSRFSRSYEVPPTPTSFLKDRQDGRRLTARLIFGHLTGQQALMVLQEQRPQPARTVRSDLGLTEREAEVLIAASHGLNSFEIADSLCISRRTVEKHFENMYSKLGVESRGAAVAFAFPEDSNSS
jgi:DNA-binding CsgD family transcriptional regulator